jgi:glycosyltransferase involved in cell wall biosynthesis
LQLRNLLGPFADRFVGFASTAPNNSGFPLVQEGFVNYRLWQQASLPRSLKRQKIDVFLSPYNTAPTFLPSQVKLILVLHDMTMMKGFRKLDMHGKLLDFYLRRQIPASVARASLVLTVSEHARSEILTGFPKANVQVIPCTIGAEWFSPSPSLPSREGYLLMVTSSAPHKNAWGAIEAYAEYVGRAGEQARPLKIVGLSIEAEEYRQKAAALGIAKSLQFMPFLSESELRELYRGAAAFLIPSFAEGFGIPVLEAMSTGTPVIAARAGSVPEVGGDAAYYFDPYNKRDMANALETVLSDEQMREQMAAKGIERARVYRPDVVGEKVIAFWREFAGVE